MRSNFGCRPKQMSTKKRIIFDFETRSKSNLKHEGGYKYSLDPSTQPTCLAFKIVGEPKVYFLPFHVVNRQWADQPPELRALWTRLLDEGYEFAAHNAFFERCIYTNILVNRYGWPMIPFLRYRCTAAKAAACALPRGLEGAGEALKLVTQKDRRGYVAMMATCKPTKKWNAWKKLQEKVAAGARITEKSRLNALEPEPKVFLEPEDAPDVWQTLYHYCKQDVRAEEAVDSALPDLIPQEQEIWHLNQKLNWRGIQLDMPTVRKIVAIMETESKKKLKELDALTMGLVTKPGARKSILEFLELEGITLPDLRAKTVDDKLAGFDLSEDMHRLLEIRRALTMTSTKKYYSFLHRAGKDGRARDLVLYHGASTGRDAGTGINVYNFPRGLIRVDKDRPYAAVDNVVECDPEMLQVLYGDSLAMLFSAILRNMIIPSPGCEMFVADFSKIEVAVLWWLADNKPGLKILREGKDPYIYQAAANLGKTYDDIDVAYQAGEKWAADARQLAKAQILGCGFGMGAPKFQKTGWDMYRLRLTLDQSEIAVKNYRTANGAVPKMWKAVEQAAVACVETGLPQTACRCTFTIKDRFLWIELPSGRKLAYREPQIAWRESDYGPRKTLEFWGLDKSKKKLQLERTWGGTLTENIVQAVARDLMMPALVRLEKAGYKVLLSVYDEGVCERPVGEGSVEEFVDILCEQPAWAPGLPLEANGWSGPRYRK